MGIETGNSPPPSKTIQTLLKFDNRVLIFLASRSTGSWRPKLLVRRAVGISSSGKTSKWENCFWNLAILIDFAGLPRWLPPPDLVQSPSTNDHDLTSRRKEASLFAKLYITTKERPKNAVCHRCTYWDNNPRSISRTKICMKAEACDKRDSLRTTSSSLGFTPRELVTRLYCVHWLVQNIMSCWPGQALSTSVVSQSGPGHGFRIWIKLSAIILKRRNFSPSSWFHSSPFVRFHSHFLANS